MQAADPLGQVEMVVLEAVRRGALRARTTPKNVPGLREHPSGSTILHQALRRCEQRGLLRSRRDDSGRLYELTPAGREQLRANRRFRSALLRTLARSRW
jgi:DNA-binding PadR family transcriptional regulator